MSRLSLLFFLVCAAAVIYTEAFSGRACADDISGYAELDYSHSNQKTDNGNGNVSTQKTDDVTQRYNLSLTKLLYPNLKFFANGIFEKDMASTVDETGKTNSTTTNIQPVVSLTLGTPVIVAGATYNRLQINTQSSGASQTLINENYSGSLGLRPEGLPSFDINEQMTRTYDPAHVVENLITDRLSVGSRFSPVKGLDLGYQFGYTDTNDKLADVTTTQINNSGTFSYNHSFWGNRVRFGVDGNVSQLQTKATIGAASTTGTAQFSQSAVSGLYAADSTADSPLGVDVPPHTPVNDAMISTTFLINGGDFLGNVGKLNIGFPQTNPADNNPRDVGLAFAQPTELDAIYVTVNQDVNSIATSYSWDVYISSDTNIGQGVSPTATQQWTLYQQGATFIFSEIDNTFRISFQKVTAQFFKVVTKPLSVPASVPGVDVNNILISQVQAFDTTAPSNAPTNKTTTTTQNYDMNLRVRILNKPVLYYDLTSYYSNTSNKGSGFAVGHPSLLTYYISNGLSGAYQFSRVFSTSARVALEDSKDQQGSGVTQIYNAAVTAAPLETLSHSLVFSSRRESIHGAPQDITSLFLTNLAQLYKGINAAFSGGLNWTTQTTLQKNTSETLNATLSFVPYKVLTINSDFTYTNSKTTGGNIPNVLTTSERSDLAFTYTPFPTLNFLGSIGVFSGANVQSSTIVNYGVNWSPFPNGTLLFNFSYIEDLNSLNSVKDTTILPTVRWNISPNTYLTITYNIFKTKSVVTNVPQNTSLDTLSTVLHVSF
ncbi:MAG: hypothetical protein ACLQF0_04180 [Dissulfurispiraceae bacterium]